MRDVSWIQLVRTSLSIYWDDQLAGGFRYIYIHCIFSLQFAYLVSLHYREGALIWQVSFVKVLQTTRMFPKIVGFPPKSSILIGFSIINHPFWGTTISGNTHQDYAGEFCFTLTKLSNWVPIATDWPCGSCELLASVIHQENRSTQITTLKTSRQKKPPFFEQKGGTYIFSSAFHELFVATT